jgi:hypothetical protein
MIIIYQGQYYGFDGGEISGAEYGHFTIRAYDDNYGTLNNSRFSAASPTVAYTVSSSGGSSTISYVSGGAGQFDPSGLWNGQGAILTDSGSCLAGCNVYVSSVNSTGTALTLLAPLYGTNVDTTATLTFGQSGYYAYFGNLSSTPVFWGDAYQDQSTNSLGLLGFTSASSTWVGAQPTRNNYDGVTYMTTPFSSVTSNGNITSNTTSGNAIDTINDVTGTYQATVNYQSAGVTKWQEGKANNGSYFIYDATSGLSAIAVSTTGNTAIGETGKALTLNGNVAGSGTMALTGAFTQTVASGNSIIGNVATSGNAIDAINDVTGTNQATVNYQSAGVTKWQEGKQTNGSFFFMMRLMGQTLSQFPQQVIQQ